MSWQIIKYMLNKSLIYLVSYNPHEVLLAQFSLYVHKGGLKPDSFHLRVQPFINVRPFINDSAFIIMIALSQKEMTALLSGLLNAKTISVLVFINHVMCNKLHSK